MERIGMKIGTIGMLLATAWGGVGGCAPPEPADYLYGHNLTTVSFEPTQEDMGIFPDKSVLSDPENPFRDAPPGPDTRWEINDQASHAAGFYSWATLLAVSPSGENQFYTALKLRAIFEEGETLPEALPYVRDMAIRAFHAVLFHFPSSVTFDVTGTVAYPLAPLAIEALQQMGGTVPPGWSLVTSPTGQVTAVYAENDALNPGEEP